MKANAIKHPIIKLAPPEVQEIYLRALACTKRGEHPAKADSMRLAWYLANTRLTRSRAQYDGINPFDAPDFEDSFREARALFIRVETAWTAQNNPMVERPTYKELGINFLTPIQHGKAQPVLPF